MNESLVPSPATSTAILLAGGQSRRMGQSKAFLPFGKETLLERLVRFYSALFSEVLVVAAHDQALPQVNARIVHDDVPDQGPLAGICAGLRAARCDTCFVASCDHPFPDSGLVGALLAELDQFDICAPRWEDWLQPLFAAYRRTLLPGFEAQLARGELRPIGLFDQVRTRILEPDDIRCIEPDGSSLMDLNEPVDYQRALEHLAKVSAFPGGSIRYAEGTTI